MANSMTGYGRGEAGDQFYRVVCEVKSVNQRFLEINIRLPRQLNPLEDGLKKTLQSRLGRGKIDVFISFEETAEKNPTLKVDKELALVYHNSLLDLGEFCGISSVLDLKTVATFPGIITAEKTEADLDILQPVVVEAFNQALNALIAMRKEEGTNLSAVLEGHNDNVTRCMAQIKALAPQVIIDHQDKLKGRIKELLGDIAIDEARFVNEVAYFAERCDIAEELARMESHQKQFTAAFAATGPIGRKLEFILQEMNRETNTIGSKANDLSLSKLVIEIKSELEKMREQTQNVE